MGMGTRWPSDTPALPSQRSTVPDNGFESAFCPILRAKTTEAGMGKKVLGSSLSRSQAVLKPKSAARVRPRVRFLPLPTGFACHEPLRHLECWPA